MSKDVSELTNKELLAELIARFEWHIKMARTIYGVQDESTMPTVQAFRHAISVTEMLRDELTEGAPHDTRD